MLRKKLTSVAYSLRLGFRYGCRRLGLPGYQIHQIYLPEEGLTYIPIPKNACSTVKHALYEIEFGQRFDYDDHEEWGFRDIHDYYQKRADAFTGIQQLQHTESKIFAVVRDPVKRLISCYRNRIVDLGDLKESRSSLRQLNLPLEPELNMFVMRLEEYREANKIIEHHSRPQHKFLGSTLSYIDEVYPISELKELTKMLQTYQPNLQMRSEKSDGTSFGLHDLSPEALEAAIEFYEEDYKLLRNYYNADQIRAQYREQ